jgi:hypothetical protein
MKAIRGRTHRTIIRLGPKQMRTISRKIEFHRVGIGWTTAARAMLLHPRYNLPSPRRIGGRSLIARNGAHGCRWRRERLPIRTKGVVARLVIHQGRGVPASVNARKRITAEMASHGPIRRFSPGAGGIRTGTSFAFLKLAVLTCPDWLSTACVPNISLLSQQDCFVTCLSPPR